MIVTIDAHRFGRKLATGSLLDRAEREEVREPM